MAHRNQCRAVRGARITAHRGVRALRAAALGLTLLAAAGAEAQVPSAGRDELLGSGSVSMPDWWGAGGRAGWLSDGDLGTAPPWTLAGLVVGAWSIEAPARPLRALPSPGILGAQEPLSWSDSVGIAAGRDAAWRGFDASDRKST